MIRVKLKDSIYLKSTVWIHFISHDKDSKIQKICIKTHIEEVIS